MWLHFRDDFFKIDKPPPVERITSLLSAMAAVRKAVDGISFFLSDFPDESSPHASSDIGFSLSGKLFRTHPGLSQSPTRMEECDRQP
jgi:hypothetical protein